MMSSVGSVAMIAKLVGALAGYLRLKSAPVVPVMAEKPIGLSKPTATPLAGPMPAVVPVGAALAIVGGALIAAKSSAKLVVTPLGGLVPLLLSIRVVKIWNR